jgi:hypothetical protein
MNLFLQFLEFYDHFELKKYHHTILIYGKQKNSKSVQNNPVLRYVFNTGLGKFIMLVSNDLFRHVEVGLGQ